MARHPALQEQERSFDTEDASEPVPPPDVVAYNELRSCADLFRLYSTGKLEIHPDFQRDVVWKKPAQTRFIDSLVKQLPIPSMCFSLDVKTQKWQVIDGLQRMSSIIAFLADERWQMDELDDIQPLLRGASNLDLKNGSDEQQRLFGLVQDVSIPITVIRCDYSKQSHMSYLFTIFHRLNSGGVRLTNQEIRNCIYGGNFNTALKEFDQKNLDWQSVKKRIWGSMDRFKSVEILLRVLAFGDRRDIYNGNLTGFLNVYMHARSSAHDENHDDMLDLFASICRQAKMAFELEAKTKLTLSFVEAVMVGLYVLQKRNILLSLDDIQVGYRKLIELPVFSDSARYAISSVDNVKSRLDAVIDTFASIGTEQEAA